MLWTDKAEVEIHCRLRLIVYNHHSTSANHPSILDMADTSPMAAQEAIEFFKAQAVNGIQSGLGTEAYKDRDDLAYALSRVPMLTPRPVKIIAMGAGFAGLALARAVHVGEIPNAKLTVYEKDASIGGTWFENRYPGYVFPSNIQATANEALDAVAMFPPTATK